MNREIERAAYTRWFDGLGGKDGMSPRAIGCMAYEERARIAEKHEAELVAALRNVLDDLVIGAHPHLHIDQIRAALGDIPEAA